MKKRLQIKSASEIFMEFEHDCDVRQTVNSIELSSSAVTHHLKDPVLLNASIVVLVLSGTATMSINYKEHNVSSNQVILLSASHLFNFTQSSDDFRCLFLFVTRDFTDEADSTDMIYKRIRYEVITLRNPVIEIVEADTDLLHKRLLAISNALDDQEHLYYKEVISNSLMAFYLDLSNVIDRRKELFERTEGLRKESIMQKFMGLLADHYRTEHKVDFYASGLGLSPHYLTLIVKQVTGQSVSDFIFEMLYSEARNLLKNSKMSIQEISIRLNFSDQSAFGKFFKRRSGLSAANYRKV